VILSGRLALRRPLNSFEDAAQIKQFISDNFERYRAKPVTRDELEPTQIVARWLRERSPDEGRLIHLATAAVDVEQLAECGSEA
jgi:hypothetical protein